MRKQYNLWPGPEGLAAWDVDRLIRLSAGLPVIELPLAAIDEVAADYWFKDGQTPTVRAVVEHVRLIHEANLSFPVILAAEGRVMDGMHRIAKALMLGLKRVDAVQFTVTPDPDYRGVLPRDLPY